MAIKNAGTATMRFKEGIKVEGDTPHGDANQLVVTGSISVMGTPSTSQTFSATPTVTETLDRNTWYYIPGHTSDDTDTDQQPRVWVDQGATQSGIPIDSGGNWTDEIFTFFGGTTRMLSLKTAVEGPVTVTFKLIEGGGGSGGQNIPHAIPKSNYNGMSYNSIGGTNGNGDWIGASTDPYSPIQVMYATDGFNSSATWTTASSDFHGHPSPHPNNASANIVRTQFNSFSVTISSVNGPYYIAIKQDSTHANYNWWGLADLQIQTAESSDGYINFEGSTWYEGEPGIGFRNNEGTMEFKDDGGDWTGFNEATPAGHDRAIQFNNGGQMGGGNFFYGANARVGIGDFTISGTPNPDYLLTIRGDKGGSGENGYVNIVEHNDGTGPGILYQRHRGSLASPTDIQDDDILGTDVYIGQVGSASTILAGQTTRYHSTNGTNMTFSLKGPSDSSNTNKLLLRDPSLMPHPDITTGNVGAFVLGAASNAFGSLYVENIRAPDGENLKFLAEDNATIMTVGSQGTYADNVGIGFTTPDYRLVVQEDSSSTPTVQIRNASTGGPTLELSRVISYNSLLNSPNVDEVDAGQTIAKINMSLDSGNISSAASIEAKSLTDWSANGSVPNRFSEIVFSTIQSFNNDGFNNFTMADRMSIDYDKVHCIGTDLEVDGALNVGTQLNCNLAATFDSSVTIGTDLQVDDWNAEDGEQIAVYRDSPSYLYPSPTLTFNPNEDDFQIQYKDQSGRETFRLQSDGMTRIGTEDGSPQFSAYDLTMNSNGGGCYIEGMNSNGSVLKVVNRSVSDDSDGITIVCGYGSYQRQSASSPLHFNTGTNSWIKFFEKKRSYVMTGSEDPDDDDPDSVRVASTISGNGSGGVTYHTSFTGAHCCVIKGSSDVVVGMILSSTGEIWLKNTENVSTSLPYVQLSTSKNDKTVFGVASSLSSHQLGYKDAGQIPDTDTYLEANGIGEGSVWITNIDGEPTNGDYITSSPIRGYGQIQSDDILRSYTVAKLTEAIDWSTVTETINHEGTTYKKYLAACTYHCG